MEHLRIARTLIKEGSIIDYYHDTIELADGRHTTFDFLNHGGASAMIPVDKDGKILMVRQYRNAIDQYSLEIPAGGLNEGEDFMTCAIRECEEETGYKPGQANHLIDIYTTVAFSNEKIAIFYTTDITKAQQHLDEDEYVTVERYPLEELINMIYQGEIKDAKTIAGLFAFQNRRLAEGTSN